MDAEIRFHGRNSAVLWVGDWSLRLAPLMVSVPVSPEAVMPPFNRHYMFSGRAEPGGLPHIAVVWLQGGLEWTGYKYARFVCVDCLTIGEDGEPDPQADADLKAALEGMEIYCMLPKCVLGTDPQGTYSSILFVDKNGELYSAIDTRPSPEGTRANVIKLQLLDEDWRPAPNALPR